MNAKQTIQPAANIEHKLYKRRWIFMVLFIGYTIVGSLQWVQFSIITNIIVKYYNVSPTEVEWTSNVYMLAYIVVALPSIYLLDKLGVRCTMIIASFSMCVGTWVKFFIIAQDKFYIVQIVQTNQAIWTMLTFSLAARFTAIWFGANEISLAGALSLFGDQFGAAFAFLIPTLFVKNSSDMTVIENGLRRMHLVIALWCTMILILVVLFFEAKPKISPSRAQTVQKTVTGDQSTFKALRIILRKPSFILFMESYGLCIGSFTAIATLMNQIILRNFQDKNEDAGNIGFALMLSGMISSLIIGPILDKIRLFKENSIILTTCGCISMILLTVALKMNNILYVYIASVLFGFSTVGYYATGFQMGIEITYPISEGISSGIMYLFTQVHALIITTIYGYAVKVYGDLASNIGISIILLISAILAFLIPGNLKRQTVEKTATLEEQKELV